MTKAATPKSARRSIWNAIADLARRVVYAIEDRRWNRSFAHSQDTLERLADEALAEARAGRTEPLDPDRLELTHNAALPGVVRTAPCTST